MFSLFNTKRIYLDHASTTPIHRDVLGVMNKWYRNNYFNPGALYAEGVSAARVISESRKLVARLLATTSDHITFTRGGTESVNLAILGVIERFRNNHPNKIPHVIVSEIEHAAVLETVADLKKKNQIDVSIVSVTHDGIVDMDELKKLLNKETVLVSVMYVNNEIGTIQPVREIAKLVRWFKKQHDLNQYPLVHTDAIQAANYLDLKVDTLGVDLLSLSGSKIYGPKSSGVLFVRDRKLIAPVVRGGDQESGLRAGTEDIAQIVGFAKSFEIARNQSGTETVRLADLQQYFFSELKKSIPEIIINGSLHDRVVNNINISIPGISGERLVIELDARGICASSKSACKEDNGEESHVIAAIRKTSDLKNTATAGSLRFTMGTKTTRSEITKTVAVLRLIVQSIQTFERTLTK